MKLTKRSMLLASLSISLCIGGGTVLAFDNTNKVGTSTTQSVSPQVSATSSYYAGLNWSWPTDSTTITEGFGNVGSRFHKGVDIGVVSVPVRSAANGVVIQSGTYAETGIVAMSIRHDTIDPSTGQNLVTRYLHLKQYSQLYDTGNYIGQYVQIATSGNTGNVGYHLHFDVNNLNTEYPADNQTIDPMQFYPTVSSFSAKAKGSSESNKEDSHENLGDFFDNNVINYIGKDKFYKWFDSTKSKDRTIANLKTKFKLSQNKINQLTVDKVKATELKISESSKN